MGQSYRSFGIITQGDARNTKNRGFLLDSAGVGQYDLC